MAVDVLLLYQTPLRHRDFTGFGFLFFFLTNVGGTARWEGLALGMAVKFLWFMSWLTRMWVRLGGGWCCVMVEKVILSYSANEDSEYTVVFDVMSSGFKWRSDDDEFFSLAPSFAHNCKNEIWRWLILLFGLSHITEDRPGMYVSQLEDEHLWCAENHLLILGSEPVGYPALSHPRWVFTLTVEMVIQIGQVFVVKGGREDPFQGSLS